MKNFSVPAGETGKTIYQKTKFHDMHYTYDTPPGDPTASRIFFKFTNQRQLEFVSQRNRLSPRRRGGSLFFFPRTVKFCSRIAAVGAGHRDRKPSSWNSPFPIPVPGSHRRNTDFLFPQQPVSYIHDLNPFIRIFRMSRPGDNHFGVRILNFQERGIFSLKGVRV